jgi:serine/threonine-protein kinase
MNLVLKVTEGPHQGKTFTFDDHDVFVVGRAPDVHFPLPDDPYFSRNHFLVELNPPLCRITDLKSRNGTQVNGRRITQPMDLRQGDRIRGGNTEIEVVLGTMELDRFRTLSAVPLPPAGPSIPAPGAALPASQSGQGSFARKERPSPEAGPAASVTLERDGAPGKWQDPPSLFAIPVIPGYRILERLGEGGMGVVYKAARDSDGKTVAVKTILPTVAGDTMTVSRFLREAEILEKLQHPNIVSFDDMGQAGKVLYFAMEYVAGPCVRQLARDHAGPFPIGRAVRLICEVLDGLTHAHHQGFVHRDIKPANVLVGGTGESEQAKLADFGLARTYQASPLSGLTLSGAAGGTPQFMPPEQVLDFRSVKPAADQFSAAATLYNLLTGELLHPGTKDLSALLSSILNEDVRPIRNLRPEVPPPLAAAIDRALKRQSAARFPDVEAFRQALFPFAAR